MNKILQATAATFCLAIFFSACSKHSDTGPVNPCEGITVSVTGTVTPASTPTSANGGITASATGGSGFTFSLNGGAYQSSGTFNGLAAGIYTITAKNSSGCTGSQVFTVTANPCPAITVSATITQASSSTATDGALLASASGSTGFTFSLNGGAFQVSGSFTGLAVGSYTVVAKDVNGCTGTNSFSVTSVSCPNIVLTTAVVNTTGPNGTNGSITASVSGGVAPYTYSIGGAFQSSNVFTNLAVGNYAVVAKDANGCFSNTVATVIQAVCPTITASASTTSTVKCESNTGAISITAAGSSGFMYSLNAGSFQSSNSFGSLAAGNYVYTVRDLNGCTITNNVSVSQAPAGPLFTSVKSLLAANCTSCHGGASPQNGLNFADDCTIVSQALRIKARAVDANPSQMPPTGPPLSTTDKQKIIDWVNAGGKHNN